MYEEEKDPSISASSWAASTKDDWYLQLMKKVTEAPMKCPWMKAVRGQLYQYNTNTRIEEVLGENDA